VGGDRVCHDRGSELTTASQSGSVADQDRHVDRERLAPVVSTYLLHHQ
jgi:hypothetical protein